MSTHDLEQPLIPSTQLQQTPNLQEHTIQEEDVKLEKSYFEIMGLCCSSEVPLIESIVKPLNGVKDISVVVPTKTLTVVHDIRIISPSQIVGGTIALQDYTDASYNRLLVQYSSVARSTAGEVIPIDGVVVEGKSEVDEKALTGESFPVIKEIGSTAFAGTINLNVVVLISAGVCCNSYCFYKVVIKRAGFI
uniref:HMA domain-containing protein n=1 Tax=Chenopodium quinoa TaxID=63459 RepID=A0A803NE66_CHEQI